MSPSISKSLQVHSGPCRRASIFLRRNWMLWNEAQWHLWICDMSVSPLLNQQQIYWHSLDLEVCLYLHGLFLTSISTVQSPNPPHQRTFPISFLLWQPKLYADYWTWWALGISPIQLDERSLFIIELGTTRMVYDCSLSRHQNDLPFHAL